MTQEEFERLVRLARLRIASLSPEEQAEHWMRQRESWARGQVALGECELERFAAEPEGETP